MQAGLERAINSSAIRLYQLQKAHDHYAEKDFMLRSEWEKFIIECLDREIAELKSEIMAIADEDRWERNKGSL